MEVPKDGLGIGSDGDPRCWWCLGDPLYESYHDLEWGRPVADDVRLFEKVSLEGFQSGLSWLTILRKRENFRRAFKGFEPSAVARFNSRSVERLMSDAGIVRNRAKIEATINNAKRYPDLVDEFGSLAAFVWRFEPEPSSRPARVDWPTLLQMAKTPESIALSKELRRRGWAFVGPTTAYAFMQSMGVVNDHMDGCITRQSAEAERKRFKRPG